MGGSTGEAEVDYASIHRRLRVMNKPSNYGVFI